MNKSIWKFTLKITDVQTIEAPAFSEPLCVQIQNGVPCLWMLVMPEMEKHLHCAYCGYGA